MKEEKEKKHDENFSNLTWSAEGDPTNKVTITIRASHLMEPNIDFMFLLTNDDKQVRVRPTNGKPFLSNYTEGKTISGCKVNAWVFAPMGGGAITPEHPLQITITSLGGSSILLLGVMHKSSADKYTIIPPSKPF